MKNVLMRATRNTRAGLLKEGKRYPVPDDLADELIDRGEAIDLSAPKPETATVKPDESAAMREGGVPEWTLATPPGEYLETYGDDAPNSELARRVLEAADE